MLLKEILIRRGETFSLDVRWGVEPYIYKAIEQISLEFGAPRLKITGHDIPDKWAVAVIRVAQPKQINAVNSPPEDDDFHEILVIDADWIEFNEMDSTGFATYTSGGFVLYKTPQDLTGYVPRMDIKDKEGGIVLASSEVDAEPLDVIVLTPDSANFKTTILIEADDTAAMAFKAGVTDLEMLGPTGAVTRLKLCDGKPEEHDPVRVTGEITT